MTTNSNLFNSYSLDLLSRLSIRKKVNLLGIFIISIFSLILFVKVIPLLESGKLEERRGKLKAVVNSIVSLIDHYEKGLREESWKKDPTQPKNISEAKEMIINHMRHMRYDKTEYFFILDRNGIMIMHPIKPELEGQSMLEKKDPKGEPIFRDLVIQSQRDSDAFVSYVWQSKYSPLIFEPQTSYGKYYWPWGWIICSGVYTQDIVESMEEINFLSAGYVIITSLITLFILFIFVYFNLSKPLLNLLKGIEEIKKDNLNFKVETFYEDELGHITTQFNKMIEKRKESQAELLHLNESLETKVIQRTSELSETLKQVQELKVRQDGDYFLTSLLLDPMQTNNNDNALNIQSQFLVKQFKNFTFRNRNASLGGDICIVESITFNNNKFLFFVNADAMGKSIQGAGGALIFGATVKAAIIRTKVESSLSTLPELWLKNLYTDLDELFSTFDGTMLMSAAMGLIDEENGLIYLLNMEHPSPVLYRDGKASFIESEFQLTKIGTPEKEFNQMHIIVFQLKNNDILILGSDGRDDIVLIGTTDINHDETLFLQTVEEADADIEKIFQIINQKGDLKDDLSLITIKYKKEKQISAPEISEFEKQILLEATKLHKNNKNDDALKILKEHFGNKHFSIPAFNIVKRIYLIEKRYADYAKLLIRYHQHFPENSENLLKISKSLAMDSQYSKAIDYSECLRLRNPNNLENLINLLKIYKLSGNFESALQIAEEILIVNEKNEIALQMREEIKFKLKVEYKSTNEIKKHFFNEFEY